MEILDPANDLVPPSSPTISSISSSDLDSQSTGSFFHDRSTTLGTLMGVSFPATGFRPPSQRETLAIPSGTGNAAGGGVGTSDAKEQIRKTASSKVKERRRRRWWRLCRDDTGRSASLGQFLEVERAFGDGGFYDAGAEPEVAVQPEGNGRLLFADGRVLPPASVDGGQSTPGAFCRFPVSLTGVCCCGVG
ncbi:uncharacterized protein At3g17950 [Malania oleifera]|uniref:uncharacterized protein At3g17950 n=1 Tax=Malania oleifera TaxID=397392 RepID=UPI0025AE0E39|nr:uncharacterized protein At3g17950 [Malania oleifera]